MLKMGNFTTGTIFSAAIVLAGCAGGGSGAGTGVGAAVQHSMGNVVSQSVGSAVSSSMGGGIQGAIMSSVVRSMAGSVLNGQIGSQLAPDDQNFRLQQLGGAVQNGAFDRSQQWTNPKTGNKISLNPLGQHTVDPKSKQKCRVLEEVMTLRNGKEIREKRRACLDPQTRKWNLVE